MTDARRARYLAAMGLPAWRLRSPAPAVPGSPAPAPAALAPAAPVPDVPAPAARPDAGAPAARGAARPLPEPAGGRPVAIGDAAWRALSVEVSACTACGLHKTRTQAVFGVGRRDADLLVIGEAPGADEDRQGEPFVGRAGQLLNAMLRAIDFERSDVYIANILKCRPPGNRDPAPQEAATCTPFLERQIRLVNPKVILAVGRIAAQWLLQSEAPIGRLRGQVFRYGESATPLVVTYHPAYLLRSPLAKATAWSDLCMVRDLLSSEQ